MLCSLLGHTFIDILKIDVEASEFDALTSFVNAHTHGDLPIGQLQLEVHAENDRANFEWFRGWWESLEAAGLRPFSLEPNLIHVTNPGCRKPFVVEVRLLVVSGKIFFFFNVCYDRGRSFATVFVHQHSWKPCAGQRCFQLGKSHDFWTVLARTMNYS